MDLITLLIVAVLIGFLVWLLTTQVPMPPMWAKAIQVIALVLLVLWLLSYFVNVPNVLPARR
jgi:hypothetical protein